MARRKRGAKRPAACEVPHSRFALFQSQSVRRRRQSQSPPSIQADRKSGRLQDRAVVHCEASNLDHSSARQAERITDYFKRPVKFADQKLIPGAANDRTAIGRRALGQIGGHLVGDSRGSVQ